MHWLQVSVEELGVRELDGEAKRVRTNRRHPPEAERRLGKTEHRQLYARDTRLSEDAPLVYIGEGQAPGLRPDCRTGNLICPVPG